MKAIILANDDKKIKTVYTKKIINQIEDLYTEQVYTKEEVIRYQSSMKDVNYIFSTWYMPEFTEKEVREYFPALKAIFYAAGTVKYFAEPFLKNGVKVFSAAKVNSIPVAEFTASQIVLANKGYFLAQHVYKAPFYSFSFKKARTIAEHRVGNYHSTIGLIGLGAVGKAVAELLKMYDLEILAYDPYVSDADMARLGVRKSDLIELFKNSDVISNHLPDFKSTKGMLNGELFSEMKNNATFINTGRGAQVVEKDLIKALKSCPERCAILDVTGHEPIWPWSPLVRMKNVFLTPHIAGSLSNEEQRMGELMVQEYMAYKENKGNNCEVTLQMLENVA